jgi:hypothetical protein
MAINQLSTANTFQQWLIATQVLINQSNYYEDRSQFVLDSANTVANLYPIILDTSNNVSNTANIFFEYSNTAFAKVNVVSDIANSAYSTANAAFVLANGASDLVYTITNDTTSNSDAFYPMFANVTSGYPNEAYVSSTKIYYNPSTGQLSATNFNSLSDINKKTDVETIKNGIKLVMELRGVTFSWKDNGQKSIGVIAQEVEKILPEVVHTTNTGEKTVSYGSIVGLLIEAIKDLKNEVNEIRNIINK